MLPTILSHLEHLVAFDTRNPPRAIDTGGIFAYLQAQLPGFAFDLHDHGAGAVSLLARRGEPKRLINVHLDTVPDSPHWSADPHRLRVTEDRAIGLGACDIKGAAAAILSVVGDATGDIGLLFSSDEEANDPRCVDAFLRTSHGFEQVFVAEPTNCEAVLAHRGISSAVISFKGVAGHASGVEAREASAVHAAMRWGVRALEHAASHDRQRFGGLTGLRFNIGRVEGGIKGNVIAPSCEVRFGFRPLPSLSIDALHADWRALAEPDRLHGYLETFRGPALPAGDLDEAERRRLAARDLADELNIPVGPAVDFWTEASLFSAAGLTAIVMGPGDITQAHSADEWVALEQLQIAAERYRRLMTSD